MIDPSPVPATPATARKRSPQKRRLATEMEIVAAFGRLLARDGVHGVGANALV